MADGAEIDDVKKAVATLCGVKDYNRIGLFNPSTRKRIADRRALVREQLDITKTGEVLVQDLGMLLLPFIHLQSTRIPARSNNSTPLGPQISWRTVYLVEYLGPILFHVFFYNIRPQLAKFDPWFYAGADKAPLTIVQKTCFYMFVAHFVKRELETALLHRFSAATMPAFNIVKNSAFYWLTAGLMSAFFIYSPRSFAARAQFGLLDIVAIALFLGGETANFIVHKHLAGLRKPGGTEKGIPSCIGSSLVTCPNYMFEVIAWVGVILVSREWAVVLFIAIGMSYMASWSRDKEKALRAYFGDKYKKKRYTFLPGIF